MKWILSRIGSVAPGRELLVRKAAEMRSDHVNRLKCSIGKLFYFVDTANPEPYCSCRSRLLFVRHRGVATGQRNEIVTRER